MVRQIFRVDRVGGAGSDGAVVTVLTAQVDLDLNTEQAAQRELARLVDADPVVVDVSSVFVAVVGLRLLLSCIQQVRRSGRSAELIMSPHLRRVACIVGHRPDELWLTLPDALAHVRKRSGSRRAGSTAGPGGDRHG
jgi:anti-anti-sigma regulatory factor